MSLDLDAIRARADAATPGPWEADDWEIYGPDREWVGETLANADDERSRLNATFIAHAITDVPDLVAEVERLTSLVGAAVRAHGAVVDEIERLNEVVAAGSAWLAEVGPVHGATVEHRLAEAIEALGGGSR